MIVKVSRPNVTISTLKTNQSKTSQMSGLVQSSAFKSKKGYLYNFEERMKEEGCRNRNASKTFFF